MSLRPAGVYAEPVTGRPPTVVRAAGAVVAAEGVTAVAVAAALVIRGIGGADQSKVSGFGTAAWFVLVGAAVLTAGRALWTGRRWGRGIAIFAQLLLLPVSWYLATSHRLEFAIPLALIAIGVLVSLFNTPALRWAAYRDEEDSAANAEPESR